MALDTSQLNKSYKAKNINEETHNYNFSILFLYLIYI
jgi:hypothetical protein